MAAEAALKNGKRKRAQLPKAQAVPPPPKTAALKVPAAVDDEEEEEAEDSLEELDLGSFDDDDDGDMPFIDEGDDDEEEEEESEAAAGEEDEDDDEDGFDSDDIDNLTGSEADEDDAAEYDWDSDEEEERANKLAQLPSGSYNVEKTLSDMVTRASEKPSEDEPQPNVLGIDPIRAARSAKFNPFTSKPHPVNPDGSAKGQWTISEITGQPKRVYPPIEPGYDSDSSTEDQPNRIGNVPLEWYDDMPHIGYDINGRKVAKPATKDELDRFLSTVEDPTAWTSATDKSTGEDVQLTESELEIIKRLEMGGIPDANYDPYEDQIEWFTGKGMEEVMPMSGRPEPKRRFVPSKHEHKRIMKIVRAIRDGRITPGAPRPSEAKNKLSFYNIWTSDDQSRADHPMHMPAPKLPLPGHAESYNPPAEYLFTEEEKKAWEETEPEDRKTSFLPAKHDALRRVPGYRDFVKERFERCLDLYLAPRIRRKRLDIEHPDDLLPQLPAPRELKPFPITTSLQYVHPETAGRVRVLAPDPSGSWLLTGSEDGKVRMWDIGLGRCVATWDLFPGVKGVGENKERAPVYGLEWCPAKGVAIFAASTAGKITIVAPPQCILSTSSTGADRATHTTSFRHATAGQQVAAEASKAAGANGTAGQPQPPTRWTRPSDLERNQGVCAHILLSSASSATGPTPKQVTWHSKGDYFATVCPDSGSSSSVLVHQLSKHRSQAPFRRAAAKGASVQRVTFHPLKPHLFVATQRHVRIYDLGAQTLLKTLQPGLRWISDVSVHPGGSHVLVSSYDRKVAWIDLELSVQPHKVLRYHSRAVRAVQFHPRSARTFPLFASVGDDGQAQVFHATVYDDDFDVGKAPLIVPLKVLRGHEVKNGLGVLDCKWHPNQPWLFTAGADGVARLWTT
ncbi:Ribosome biogenesis protein erb1 [Tilletia horrida]|uniref:Ribosome biogenesis protein ERB1 n=1 Tax=Tilletia horrida TaxID=155126 RepID=A0AAN6JX06_9BASI|nr:Ribosome biogenesis protein erb1 [Tilletia horrida]KAK0557495.1 Ribosome biogenesis protein erb1 [Tilletia horrida]KAK0567888.1 Ribosome biogenesis protein erb1 [Tilletia horrida]